MLGADVTPSVTQDHWDVPEVPQTQAGALHPAGCAARGARQAGHPDALLILPRAMGHQVFDGFILHRFPGPGQRHPKAPAPPGILRIALADHRHMLLGAIGGVPRHNHPLGPRRGYKVAHHLTEQRIFRAVLRMAFRSDQPKRGWEALDIPVDDPQGKAKPAKPGLLCAFPSFLGQRVLRTTLGLVPAVPYEQ